MPAHAGSPGRLAVAFSKESPRATQESSASSNARAVQRREHRPVYHDPMMRSVQDAVDCMAREHNTSLVHRRIHIVPASMHEAFVCASIVPTPAVASVWIDAMACWEVASE